ncbi:hypothetical protein ACIBFB_21495 [Nocardiopsis sp. NPDC050513]|uniref:hypothetical protein n=1 Tax=Nocardiopsis sp. NPDC050513 TaxID=3364338 RepID=UPI0037B40172
MSENGSPSGIAPLPGRDGHVGGIESMTIDGRRYYFGFDYKGDMVVSPLIDDPDAMAAFASEHMLLTDGAHDAAYWRDLVDDAVRESGLCYDTDRVLTSERLSREPMPPRHSHLRYLLGTLTGHWDEWPPDASLPGNWDLLFGLLGGRG